MEHPYIKASRLYSAKMSGENLTFSDIYEQVFGLKISNDEACKRLRFVRDAMAAESGDFEDSFGNEVNFRDEYNAIRQEKRELVRLQRFEKIVKDEIKTLAPLTFPAINTAQDDDIQQKHAVLQLSDIHYGLLIDNAWNTYNTDVCRHRFTTLLNEVIRTCIFNQVTDITVVIQGDLISGNIHNIIRLQNQIDVIDQLKGVTELLVSFLSELAVRFRLDVYFVNGNHERLTADKSNNLPDENLLEVIHWIVEEWFKNCETVTVHNNKFGPRLATFGIHDLKIAAVHGDYDKFSNLYNNISAMSQEHFDIILTAHNHHMHMEDIQNCFVISNGSVCGVDEYSFSLRLFAKPSQNLIIINNKNDISVTPIILDQGEKIWN